MYGFGLTESDLNRLEFNREAIFFDFGYAGHPELFGLVFYLDVEYPIEVIQNVEQIEQRCSSYLDPIKGITVDSLRVFPLVRSIVSKFRYTPYWAFETHIEITHPEDQQVFFAGRDERDIKHLIRSTGLVK